VPVNGNNGGEEDGGWPQFLFVAATLPEDVLDYINGCMGSESIEWCMRVLGRDL